MRVIQLGPFPPPHGGVQTNLVAIRNHLRAHGHRAAVIHLTRHRQHNHDEVYYPKTALETVQLLLTEPADVLHLHIGGNLSARLLGLCLFCTLVPGRKSVLTFHSGGFCSSPEGQAIGKSSFAAWVFRRLDGVIAVNQEIFKFFQRCGVAPSRLHLISPHSSAVADEALPPQLQAFFDAHSPLLLSVGLLEPEYDLPLQIAALGRVREKYPNAGLLMIGSGSLDAELRQLMAAQPYAEHLLLPGDVPHGATLRAIQQCDILLRTTHYDGDALSVREALSMGTPVITTENGMRPAGCHIIPGPQLEPLVDKIGELLTAMGGKRQSAAGEGVPVDNRNLDAVLAVYDRILR